MENEDEQGDGPRISPDPIKAGYCQVEFSVHGETVTFTSTAQSFLTAALGAKSHFASDDGACELSVKGNRIRATVKHWGGAAEVFEFDKAEFTGRLYEIAQSSPKSRGGFGLL